MAEQKSSGAAAKPVADLMSRKGSTNPWARYTEAIIFATIAHDGQRRKNPDKLPYIVHPLEVAWLIDHYWPNDKGEISEDVRIAAILHDTLEDTRATPEEIELLFGAEVLRLVKGCSDNKADGKIKRKICELQSARDARMMGDEGICLIKECDKVSNMSDLFIAPPPAWTPGEVRGYAFWAFAVCMSGFGIAPGLDAHVCQFLEMNGFRNLEPAKVEEEIKKYYAEIERVEAAKAAKAKK